MIYLIGITVLFLLGIILVQVGRVTELAASIRGEEEVSRLNNDRTAFWLLVFMIGFLVFSVVSAWYYKDMMLGYGPLKSASAHGSSIDGLFNTTLIWTGIIFFITQVLLFWYPYKYRAKAGAVSKFFPHDNKLELIWTFVPIVVMTYLVAQGLIVWNEVMPDVTPEEEYLEIEATGYQFAWDIRYPGPDNKLGNKDYTLIDPAANSLGLDFTDDNAIDDIMLSGADNIVLPVDTTIRVRITSKDVLHNFYLPHFRVKMDAVPGMATYFIFEPIKTTREFREELKKYPEWNEPYDPTDPESLTRWEEFHYELACAELCGTGHWSMRRVIEVVERDEYEDWIAGQQSFYKKSVRGSDIDPRKGELLGYEIADRKAELRDLFATAFAEEATAEEKLIRLKHVFFDTGSAQLDNLSRYELTEIANILDRNPNSRIELAGHTDSQGDDALNLELSEARAISVMNYLAGRGIGSGRMEALGYGESSPIDTNETEEGREMNRRTELRILSR